jgi:diguanylate cyclase (GGDEF)-like protein
VALHALPFATDAEPGQAKEAASRRVLLVGLDASSRKEASRWLASAGFEVVTADDASSALTGLESSRPDVIFADASLRADGLRALGHGTRAEDGRAVPIVALCSGRRDVGLVLDAGIADLVELPCDWRVVSHRFRSVLHLAETECELRLARREAETLRRTLDEERREKAYRETRDALTGLPNGEHLERALESALVGASEASPVALAIFEVEQLVLVNNRLGRARANSVLQQVAQRLSVGLRSEEVLHASVGPSMSMAARIGGGLFAAMLTGLPGWQELKTTVSLLVGRLSGRYFAGDEEIVLSTSAGIALAPADGLTAETMLQKAELAASEAVASGGGVRFYGQSQRVSERSRAIIRLLPQAVAKGEMKLRYQPLVEWPERRVYGAEALLRWESAELGSVPPSEFVPLAEEAGLMMSIGSWGLRTAAAQARAWRDRGLPIRCVAVNVSLCQLVRGDLAQVVREVLRESGIDASMLELELSERGVLRSDPEILGQLRAIRALGVHLAIDDFGTGNSAVAYLKQFPIDILKIDQSFVRGVASSPEDAAITSATIAMARQLGLRVVAEGVEEPGQMEFLRSHGCSEYQGFLFSPAVPPDDFARILQRGLDAISREGDENP